MKKLFATLLAVLMLASALAACGDTPTETTPSDSPPAQTTPSGTEKTGEVVVTGEKYAYKNKDVLLLKVQNQTDNDYDITVIVHYFDAEGTEIKSQKQTFTGLASGYQNYFLFQPNSTFDAYTHTMELEEIDSEECYAEQITATFVELREFLSVRRELVQKGDFTKYSTIGANIKLQSNSANPLRVSGFLVLIDKNGCVYSIKAIGQPMDPHEEKYSMLELYYGKTQEKLVWPDELTDDVTAIFVVTSVKISE